MRNWYGWFIEDLLILIMYIARPENVFMYVGCMIICSLAGFIHLAIEKCGKNVKTRVRILEISAVVGIALFLLIYILAVL